MYRAGHGPRSFADKIATILLEQVAQLFGAALSLLVHTAGFGMLFAVTDTNAVTLDDLYSSYVLVR